MSTIALSGHCSPTIDVLLSGVQRTSGLAAVPPLLPKRTSFCTERPPTHLILTPSGMLI